MALLFIFHMAKMGRNLSGNNADVYPLHKSLVGIRTLLNQTDVCYHDTDTFNVNENVNQNE